MLRSQEKGLTLAEARLRLALLEKQAESDTNTPSLQQPSSMSWWLSEGLAIEEEQ